MKTSTTIISKTKNKKEKLTLKQILLRILTKTLITVGVFAFWVLLWQIIYEKVGKDIIVPSPYNTWLRIKSLVSEEFWKRGIRICTRKGYRYCPQNPRIRHRKDEGRKGSDCRVRGWTIRRIFIYRDLGAQAVRSQLRSHRSPCI